MSGKSHSIFLYTVMFSWNVVKSFEISLMTFKLSGACLTLHLPTLRPRPHSEVTNHLLFDLVNVKKKGDTIGLKYVSILEGHPPTLPIRTLNVPRIATISLAIS